MSGENQAWRCTVCGYIHYGSEPPDVCPVCGVPDEFFEPYEEPKAAAVRPPATKWRCQVCSYMHVGSEAPDACPVCGAHADRFEPLGPAAGGRGSSRASRVVIVGAGVAGLSAAESIRRASEGAEITLVGREPELPYYRLNLTRYLAGEIGREDLTIHPESWYEEQRIRLALGVEASSIDLEGRSVKLSDGESLPYDKLLLAVGGDHPFIPPVAGADREGVTALRTVADAEGILESIAGGAKCVCIGGGVLGIETAAGLARRGADVTLLEGHEWLMPRQLNRAAGEVLARHLTEAGITLRKEARTREILGDERAEAVLLEDGDRVPADLVVIATGVRSNSYLARLAGLDVNRGVVVDDTLATSHGDVFAAGDLAEHRGECYGLWAPAQHQGSMAGLNMTGAHTPFGGIPRATTLKVVGVDMFSVGRIQPEDASYKVVESAADGHYRLFVLHDNRLVGAILLGDTQISATVQKAVEQTVDLSAMCEEHPTAEGVAEYLTGHVE